MKVIELTNKKLITIDANSPVRNAVKLMNKHNISRLLVTKNKKIVGIVTFKDLARRLGHEKERSISDAHVYVSSCYSKKLITINADSDIKEAAKLMLKNDISSLIVVDNEEIVGIVTKTDLIKALTQDNRKVREFMHRKVTTVAPNTRVLEARKILINKKISRLPVIKGNELVGMLCYSDISNFLQKFRQRAEGKHWNERLRQYTVQDIMSKNVITINPEDTLGKAAKIMIEHDISGLPVVENGSLVGIITKKDLLRALAYS